jgi:Transposase DDE domain
MECSTTAVERKELILLEKNWEKLETGLGIDLAGSAWEHKAFVRARGIRSAGDLLRLGLVFGLQERSYSQLSEWALLRAVGDLAGEAVRKRLYHMEAWLDFLIGKLVERRCSALGCQAGWKVRLQDATTVSRPGSRGTDARLHLTLDLSNLCVSGVEVTDAHGGESLARFAAAPDEIRVGDRGYAFASGMGPVLQKGCLVVRINWQNLPLWTANGERFDLSAWLREQSQMSEASVIVRTPQGDFPVRLLAAPLAPDKVEAARRRARRAAEKKHHTVSDNTLLAAGWILLLSNLPETLWPSELVFWLYRLRWQIELVFKRYKSLLHLDQVRASDPKLIRVCLLCKILAILLLDQLVGQVRLQAPEWFADPNRPVSLWRLTQSLWAALQHLIVGPLSLQRFFACLPALERCFRSAPRRRRQQLAWALAVLDQSDPSFSFVVC